MRSLPVVLLAALAYLLAWLVPAVQATVTPQRRAETFVASTICVGRAAVLPANNLQSFARQPPVLATHTPAQVAELAQPFVAAFTARWRRELLALALAAVALAALLARSRWTPYLLLGSIVALVGQNGVRMDALTLLSAAGPRLWWNSISQWTPAMLHELIVVPLALATLLGFALWTALPTPGRVRR